MGGFPPDKRLVRRPATLDDLEDIATVAQQGFPDDPEFDYRFPHRDKYPEDNRKWILQEYREYLEQPDKYEVIIVTAGDNNNKAVALSVWDISISKAHQGSGLGVPDDPNEQCQRRDVNPVHFRKFKERMGEAFERYFGAYGKDQIHLWLLATHPDFRRRGAGTRLCQWGQERASRDSLHTTVLASPMGKSLYEELRFTNSGTFFIQVDGETDKLKLWAMEYSNTTKGRWNYLGWFLSLLSSVPFVGQK
ncbi:acyl-CoA N-acyltransferase [Jackrogersella minutella]|nr:acyl-CoA N-acyltransferase [Jackrogersella minutella]